MFCLPVYTWEVLALITSSKLIGAWCKVWPHVYSQVHRQVKDETYSAERAARGRLGIFVGTKLSCWLFAYKTWVSVLVALGGSTLALNRGNPRPLDPESCWFSAGIPLPVHSQQPGSGQHTQSLFHWFPAIRFLRFLRSRISPTS